MRMSKARGKPALKERRLTFAALPVGPAAGMIDLGRELVLRAAGADQVGLAADGARHGGNAGVAALHDRRELRGGSCAEGVVLSDLERVVELCDLAGAERRHRLRSRGLHDYRVVACAVFVIGQGGA